MQSTLRLLVLLAAMFLLCVCEEESDSQILLLQGACGDLTKFSNLMETHKAELKSQKDDCEKQLDDTKEKAVSSYSKIVKQQAGDLLQMEEHIQSLQASKTKRNAVDKVLQEFKPITDASIGTYFLSSSTGTWNNASNFCQQAGMKLASIETNIVNDFLVFGKKVDTLTSSHVWVSGTTDSTGKFFWNSTGNSFNFTYWQLGYPKHNLQRSCVELHHNTGCKFDWVNEDCEKKNLFLCERSKK